MDGSSKLPGSVAQQAAAAATTTIVNTTNTELQIQMHKYKHTNTQVEATNILYHVQSCSECTNMHSTQITTADYAGICLPGDSVETDRLVSGRL